MQLSSSWPSANAASGSLRALSNHSLGVLGETLALDFFQKLGFCVVERNWRHQNLGELDLVVRNSTALVAVEVKTRRGSGFGSPLEAITVSKVQRLRTLLRVWVAQHPHEIGTRYQRIDALGVLLCSGMPPKYEHVSGIE